MSKRRNARISIGGVELDHDEARTVRFLIEREHQYVRDRVTVTSRLIELLHAQKEVKSDVVDDEPSNADVP